MSTEVFDTNGEPIAEAPSILPAHLIDPAGSVARLNQLKFDPIHRLTTLYDNIDRELHDMMYDEEDRPRRKFSQVAVASLYALQAKISGDLLRYGYIRTPEVQEVRSATPEPIRITLTSEA